MTVTITIELPDTFTVESREQVITIEVARIPVPVLTRCLSLGLCEKVRNAASDAIKAAFEAAHDGKLPPRDQIKSWATNNYELVRAQTLPMMQKTLDAMYAGTLRAERGEPNHRPAWWQQARELISQILTPGWDKKLSTPDRRAQLDELLLALTEPQMEAMQKAAETRYAAHLLAVAAKQAADAKARAEAAELAVLMASLHPVE